MMGKARCERRQSSWRAFLRVGVRSANLADLYPPKSVCVLIAFGPTLVYLILQTRNLTYSCRWESILEALNAGRATRYELRNRGGGLTMKRVLGLAILLLWLTTCGKELSSVKGTAGDTQAPAEEGFRITDGPEMQGKTHRAGPTSTPESSNPEGVSAKNRCKWLKNKDKKMASRFR